jgi:hypothetical protein
MTPYDPDHGPDVAAWLAADEPERIAAVERFHRPLGMAPPQARLHAAIHVVVETQLVLPEPDVVAALERLQEQGLTRHDAIHAIGTIVSDVIFEALRASSTSEPAERYGAPYLERVRQLNADDWLATAKP